MNNGPIQDNGPTPDKLMNTASDNAFDRRLQQLHAQSLAQISPQTLAKLRNARHAATQPAPARGWNWRWLAAGMVPAVFALAIGVPYLQQQTTSAPATTVAAAQAVDNYDDALSENPDLYVWLASDGQQLAME
ncbi:MAG: hypothetical protein QM769_11020 [Pseudoxanthomonas sp.]